MKPAELITSTSDRNEYLFINAETHNLKRADYVPQSYEIIQVGDLKGIVFNFTNFDIDEPCYDIKTPGSIVAFKAVVRNSGVLDWKNGDKIRVMYLNEVDVKSFRKLIPYFEARLAHYGYLDPVGPDTYKKFSTDWSNFMSANPVDDICAAFGPIPRQTKGDDILTIGSTLPVQWK